MSCGPNVSRLVDPGFETRSGGPAGNELPLLSASSAGFWTGAKWPSDDSIAPITDIAQSPTASPSYGGATIHQATLSTASPRTGAKHLRIPFTAQSTSGATVPPTTLHWYSTKCGTPPVVGAVVTPGDTLVLWIWCKLSAIPYRTLRPVIRTFFYDADLNYIVGDNETVTGDFLTTSWTQTVLYSPVPAGAKYFAYSDVAWSIGAAGSGGGTAGTVQVDIDDIEYMAYGAGRLDRLRWDGWIEDPQFERQMQWNDGTIPQLMDFLRWDAWQKINYEVTGYQAFDGTWQATTLAYSQPGFVNTWIQFAPTDSSWEIVEGIRLAKEPRPTPYSAKFEFGSLGVSPWLFPIGRPSSFFEYWWGYNAVSPIYPEDAYWHTLSMQFWTDSNEGWGAYPRGGFMEIGPNPPGNRWELEQEIYVTAECQWEVDWQLRGDHDFDQVPPLSGSGENTWVPKLIKGQVDVVDLSPGWNTIRSTFLVPAGLHPNVPDRQDPALQGLGNSAFGWVRFRAKGGAVGEAVHLSRSLVWPDMGTQVSIPLVTVGVAEWIRAADGTYVGCRLWVKVGGLEATQGHI